MYSPVFPSILYSHACFIGISHNRVVQKLFFTFVLFFFPNTYSLTLSCCFLPFPYALVTESWFFSITEWPGFCLLLIPFSIQRDFFIVLDCIISSWKSSISWRFLSCRENWVQWAPGLNSVEVVEICQGEARREKVFKLYIWHFYTSSKDAQITNLSRQQL